jgi:hypothetical protein
MSQMADFQEGEGRFIDGDTIIKQSPMAWMLPAFPWVVILSVAAFTDFLTFGLLPVGLAMLVVLPRYFSWRNSKFILTNSAIIVARAGFGKSSEIEVLISAVKEYAVSPGLLGGPLGYRKITLYLDDAKMLPMTYIPADSSLEDHLTSRGVTLKVETPNS